MSLGRRLVWTYSSVPTLLIAKVGVWGKGSSISGRREKNWLFVKGMKRTKANGEEKLNEAKWSEAKRREEKEIMCKTSQNRICPSIHWVWQVFEIKMLVDEAASPRKLPIQSSSLRYHKSGFLLVCVSSKSLAMEKYVSLNIPEYFISWCLSSWLKNYQLWISSQKNVYFTVFKVQEGGKKSSICCECVDLWLTKSSQLPVI